MKIPEKAPEFSSKIDFAKIMTLSEELGRIVKRANEQYIYWDNFKYIDFPSNITAKEAWLYLRLMRDSQSKESPIRDKGDKNFRFWLPESIQKTLHYVDQNAGGQIFTEDPRFPSGEAERYMVNSLMEEAIASSQLEGAATTRKKAKEMLRSGRKPANTAEQMILNNYITITNIKDLIKEPLTRHLILEIQAMITKDTLEDPSAVGRFREEEEEIHVVEPKSGQLLHQPPSANEIEGRISNLCNYANETNGEEFVHPVIKAIILHFWLAYIHPFVDGNGRTARALFYWYMLKHGYWLFEYLPISRIIKKTPIQYARSYLYSEIDSLDLTYFLVFNLKCINTAIEEFLIYLQKKQKEIKEAEKFIKKYPGLNYRQSELLRHAISHPDAIYTIKYHKNIHNIVYQTARADIIDLEAKSFLEKQQRGKEFFFVPAEDISKKLKKAIE